MPATVPSAARRPATDLAEGRAPSPWLRAVLVAGVAVTAVSALALAALLVAYFLSAPALPLLDRLALYGLPAGFGLLVLHLVLSAVRRARS